jgi:hypothetical protein
MSALCLQRYLTEVTGALSPPPLPAHTDQLEESVQRETLMLGRGRGGGGGGWRGRPVSLQADASRPHPAIQVGNSTCIASHMHSTESLEIQGALHISYVFYMAILYKSASHLTCILRLILKQGSMSFQVLKRFR